jgi:hypothetical protein
VSAFYKTGGSQAHLSECLQHAMAEHTAQNIRQLYTEIMYLKFVCLFFESEFTCNPEFKAVPFGSDHIPRIRAKTCTLSEQ